MTTQLFQPVILSGGSGTRLWPLSRKALPKQMLPLTGETTLLQATADRLAHVPNAGPAIVIANDDHRFLVARQLEEAGHPPSALILEPLGRNTAPAVAIACLVAMEGGADPIVGVFASDHRIGDVPAFVAAVETAIQAATEGWITTFAIRPDRPETGYGYIKTGAPLNDIKNTFQVSAFVEKPTLETAKEFLTVGGYGWNSGMFVFRASTMIEELEEHAADVLAAARQAYEARTSDLGFSRLPEAVFAASPSVAIDVAVMEKTSRAATVLADFDWSDLGAWDALHAIAEKDADGNAVSGHTALQDSRNSFVRAEDGRLVAGIGLEDMVVVSTADAVLVAPRAKAAAVKELVSHLSAQGHAAAEHHPRVTRPWGQYEDIDREDGFRVKRIIVLPGARLSLQRHKHRSEHWIVVRGKATVTIDDTVSELTRNQSTYVPIGATHRLENKGDVPLHLIEVQVGDYVEEDDIERLDDVYGRV